MRRYGFAAEDGKNTLFKVLTGKRDSVEWKSVALSASTVGG
jgi:hypothetical protein